MEYTPQEAIDNIDEILNSTVYYDESLEYEISSYDFDWLKVAKSALEKQIPKKPDLINDGYDDNCNLIYDTWICPCCQTEYELDYDKYQYCPNCGQRIDWSETKGNVGKENDD